MKKLTILVFTISIFFSCRSVNKMMEQGNYDQAIDYSIKKIKGEKNPETKYVETLEQAYAKANRQGRIEIQSLRKKPDAVSWDKIYDIYTQLDRRQNKILPYRGLVSSKGYAAYFEIKNWQNDIQNAGETASMLHYKRGNALLTNLDVQDKQNAREAYDNFEAIERYSSDFKDAYLLKDKAYYHGVTRIHYAVTNRSGAFLPIRFNEDVAYVDTDKLNSKWNEFITNQNNRNDIDYRITLLINTMDISPEREELKDYNVEREISDDFTTTKDTSGVETKVEKFITVAASVYETYRTKYVLVRGNLSIYDVHARRIIDDIPVEAEAKFEDLTATYRGDKRALSNETRDILVNRTPPFPEDLDMLYDVSDALKSVLNKNLQRFEF